MQNTDDKVAHLKKALKRISEGASLRSVSRDFGIPRATLYDKIHGKTAVDSSYSYYQTELTPEEEDGLVSWIKGMAERGLGRYYRRNIQAQVKKILDSQGRRTRFRDNLPGKDWYYGFLSRHPDLADLSLKSPTQLSKQRSIVASGMVQNWFKDLKEFLDTEVKDQTLFEEPERWFNADETGFPVCPKSGKVVCQKGSSNECSSTTCEKSVITVMACLSASGAYVQPMIVFSGTSFNYNPLEGFDDAAFGLSSCGCMDTELFFTWLKNVFIVYLDSKKIKRPVVLLVDSHRTHLITEASSICSENGIILYCLLANASHLMQPCELRLFSSLKISWLRAVLDFQDQNPGEVVTKRTFARVLKPAWEQSAKPELAIGGFRDAGIFPFNPAQVADSHKRKPCRLFTASTTGSLPCGSPISSTPAPTTTTTQSPPIFSVSAATSTHGASVTSPFHSTQSAAQRSSYLLQALDLGTLNSHRTRNCFCGLCRCPCALSSSTQILPQSTISSSAIISQKDVEEQQAEEERKRLREEKKRKATEEKERKKAERENAKRQKRALEQQMMIEMENSDDDIASVDVNTCPRCDGKFIPAECHKWIGCNNCPRWLHKDCADHDFSSLTEEELEEIYFECVYC